MFHFKPQSYFSPQGILILQYLWMFFVLAFCAGLALHILPNRSVLKTLAPINEYLYEPLSIRATSWSMFSSAKSSIEVARTVYQSREGTVNRVYDIPLIAHWYPSVWDKVFENMLGRNQRASNYRKNYLESLCVAGKENGLREVRIEVSRTSTVARMRPDFNVEKLEYTTLERWQCN